MVDARRLDQVQALVLHAAALVGEHERGSLCDVHDASSPNAHDARRKSSPLQNIIAQPVDQLGGRFFQHADEVDLITFQLRNAINEVGLVLEVVVHHEDNEAIVLRALWSEDLIELVEAATAITRLGYGLEVAKEVHRCKGTKPGGTRKKPHLHGDGTVLTTLL